MFSGALLAITRRGGGGGLTQQKGSSGNFCSISKLHASALGRLMSNEQENFYSLNTRTGGLEKGRKGPWRGGDNLL